MQPFDLSLHSRPAPSRPRLKEGGDPVTAADLAVNDVLLDLLPQPGEGWLSEETADNADRLGRTGSGSLTPSTARESSFKASRSGASRSASSNTANRSPVASAIRPPGNGSSDRSRPEFDTQATDLRWQPHRSQTPSSSLLDPRLIVVNGSASPANPSPSSPWDPSRSNSPSLPLLGQTPRGRSSPRTNGMLRPVQPSSQRPAAGRPYPTVSNPPGTTRNPWSADSSRALAMLQPGSQACLESMSRLGVVDPENLVASVVVGLGDSLALSPASKEEIGHPLRSGPSVRCGCRSVLVHCPSVHPFDIRSGVDRTCRINRTRRFPIAYQPIGPRDSWDRRTTHNRLHPTDPGRSARCPRRW